MIYVELQRAYRALRVYAGVVALLTVCAVVGILQVRGHIVVPTARIRPHSIGFLVAAAVYCALAIPIVLGNTLARENATLPIAWTRPVPRARIALGFVAVDLAAILVAVAIAFAGLSAIIAAANFTRFLTVGPDVPGALLAGVGMTFMWYALLQAGTAASDAGRGGSVRGLSAPVLFVLAALYGVPLPPALHGAIAALNVLNPIAWYTGSSSSEPGVHIVVGVAATSRPGIHRLFAGIPEPLAIAAPWIIGALLIALAIRLWSRHQTTR